MERDSCSACLQAGNHIPGKDLVEFAGGAVTLYEPAAGAVTEMGTFIPKLTYPSAAATAWLRKEAKGRPGYGAVIEEIMLPAKIIV